MLQVLAAVTGGYLVGSFPTAYVVTRWRYGRDIRALGDRNVGAGNVWQAVHPLVGLFVAAVDIAKGIVAVGLARFFEVPTGVMGAMMLAAVAGHAWPVFLRFRGGGGVATGGGALLAAMPMLTITAIAGLMGIIAVTRRPKAAVALGFGSIPFLALWQGETRSLLITSIAMPFLIGLRVFQQGLAHGLSRRESLRLILGLHPAEITGEDFIGADAASLPGR
ncbi:MAG TPA: glycerol-3-phosphate acyltransferase [Dehalococcoidia bacterium]|nr:glycerol-3-phosphate acyltransferase [Dehalococcoidia bacterium]